MCSKIWQAFENFSSSMETIEMDHYFPCLTKQVWCALQKGYQWLFALEGLGCGPQNLMVPHFLDETMGKPMGHGSKTFVQSVNSIWTKRMDHVHFLIKKYFVKLFFGNVAALTFYSSFIFIFLLFQVPFLVFFSFKFFPSSFASFINNHTLWTRCLAFVPFKFPMSSNQVPDMFPNMFSIAPHFYPICFGKFCPPFTYIFGPEKRNSILKIKPSDFGSLHRFIFFE